MARSLESEVCMLGRRKCVLVCGFMLVCFLRRFPLVTLSDIWQGDFLACGQAE